MVLPANLNLPHATHFGSVNFIYRFHSPTAVVLIDGLNQENANVDGSYFASSLIVGVSLASPMVSETTAAMYSTGFEDFTLGRMSSGGTTRNGWSGGAQADFTNNDAGDEQIVNTVAHLAFNLGTTLAATILPVKVLPTRPT